MIRAVELEVETYRPHDVPEIVKTCKRDIYKAFIGEYQGYRFNLVAGQWIRNHIDVDFIEGGNFARDLYVPLGELWIEYYMEHGDRVYTMLHEFLETRLMVEHNWRYDDHGEKAHSYADGLEGKIRKMEIKMQGLLMPDFQTLLAVAEKL